MVEACKEGYWIVAAVADTDGLTSTLEIAAPDGNMSTLEMNVLNEYVMCSRSARDDSVYENVGHEARMATAHQPALDGRVQASLLLRQRTGRRRAGSPPASHLGLPRCRSPATVSDAQYDSLRIVLGVDTLDVSSCSSASWATSPLS